MPSLQQADGCMLYSFHVDVEELKKEWLGFCRLGFDAALSGSWLAIVRCAQAAFLCTLSSATGQTPEWYTQGGETCS